MKLILISKRSDKVRTFSLNSWMKVLLSAAVVGIPVAAGMLLGLKLADGRWQLPTIQKKEEQGTKDTTKK